MAQGDARWLYGAAISLALLLLGDGSAWAVVAILGLGLAAAAWRGDRRRLLARIGRQGGQGLALLGSLLVLTSTGLFTNLSGIQRGLLDPLFAWVKGFTSAAWPMPWHYYLTALVIYEPAVVVFSLVALALWAINCRRSEREASLWWPALLGGWMMLSLGWLTVHADKPPPAILHALAPGALLAGWGIGRVLEDMGREEVLAKGGPALAWVLFLIIFAVTAIISPVSLFGGRFATLERQLQLVHMAIVGIVLLMLIVMAVSLARYLGSKGAVLAVALWALVGLSVLSIHQAWMLSYFPNSGEMLAPAPTSPEVRLLVQDLTARARFVGETNMGITMEANLRYPLAWYLREYRQLTLDSTDVSPKTPVVIVNQASDRAAQAHLDGYSGQRYRLRTVWNLAVTPGASLWKWLANRVPLAPAVGEDIIVYTQ